MLTYFYAFVFVLLALTGFVLAQPKIKLASQWATIGGIIAAILLIPASLYFIRAPVGY